ncbi:MAG: recombination mediator RecR [Acidobacteriota bacterium]
MRPYAPPVEALIEEFRKLPGLGPKSAQRIVLYLVRAPASDAEKLASAILELKRSIRHCSICCNITDVDPCQFCTDPNRDHSVICVLEEPHSLIAIEKTREYRGLYHVLMGVLSPLQGIGPDQLRIQDLMKRLETGEVREIIVATNPSVEGEATALYLSKLIKPLGLRVTRIAVGMPVGSDLDYADAVTVSRALEGRRDF